MVEKRFHFLAAILFLVIAIVLTLGRVGTSFRSFALLTPDVGVYASTAAALQQPQLFKEDPFLSNPQNINSYNMIYLPLIEELNTVFGNYGTACVVLVPFFIFIHLLGYYVLGLALFKKPWAALFVTLLVSAPVFNNYDFWGLILDSLPRFLYQALIPFVLALAVWYGKNPKSWIWILIGVGLLNYTHPLSSPPWIVAVILGLWLAGSEVKFWQRVRVMMLACIGLVIVLLPFLGNYFGSTVAESSKVVNYDQVISILQARYPAMPLAHPWLVLANIIVNQQGVISNLLWYVLCLAAVGGLIYGWLPQADLEHRARTVPLTGWMIGILIGGGIVPIIEHAVYASLRKIPPEFELTRTLRYMMPLILLAALSTLWLFKPGEPAQASRRPWLSNNGFVLIWVALLATWSWLGVNQRPDVRSSLAQDVHCWLQARIVCPLNARNVNFIAALDAIREKTPVGARLLSEWDEVAVRYYALRPVMYSFKDGAPLAYTNQVQLLAWDHQREKMDYLTRIRRYPFRRKEYLKTMVEFALKTQADYLLLAEPYNANLYYPMNMQPVYGNAFYSLYQIRP